jgi:hypothetical protein
MYPQYKAIMAVSACDAELLSQQGWVLLEVLKAQQIDTGYREEADPNVTYSGSPPRRFAVPFVVEGPLFLMGKDEETVVAELRAAVTVLEAEVSGLRERGQADAKAVGRFIEEKKALEASLTRNLDSYYSLDEASRALQDRARKMEEDLARVRKHVGSKLFDEAISLTKKGT